jgi:hypothetical protein
VTSDAVGRAQTRAAEKLPATAEWRCRSPLRPPRKQHKKTARGIGLGRSLRAKRERTKDRPSSGSPPAGHRPRCRRCGQETSAQSHPSRSGCVPRSLGLSPSYVRGVYS